MAAIPAGEGIAEYLGAYPNTRSERSILEHGLIDEKGFIARTRLSWEIIRYSEADSAVERRLAALAFRFLRISSSG
jgi:hypothetical protein